MDALWYIGGFLVVIGVVVTVHEFGHFIVARLCGVHVLRFSFGFGNVVWSRQRSPDATEWALSAIPLGGYVKMLDEREGPVPEALLGKAFNRQHVLKRIAILLAGPMANFVLAVLIYWVVFMVGSNEAPALVGQPKPGTALAQTGVRNGDLIVAVAGVPVRNWEDFHWQTIQRIAEHLPFALAVKDGDGHLREYTVDPAGVHFDPDQADPLQELGFSAPKAPYPVFIGQVADDSPAARAGLLSGDRIVSIDGVAVDGWERMSKLINAAPERDIALEFSREGEHRQIRLRPVANTDAHGVRIGRIGVGAAVKVRYPPHLALQRAALQTWDTAVFSVKMMGRMLTGKVSVKNLSGPLTIADYAGQSAKMGLDIFARVLAGISIGIGVLNLLPIPLLDGGHIMYYLAEMLTRRPVPPRIMEFGQQIGFALLAMLMAFALFNDITRQLS